MIMYNCNFPLEKDLCKTAYNFMHYEYVTKLDQHSTWHEQYGYFRSFKKPDIINCSIYYAETSLINQSFVFSGVQMAGS